MTELAGREPTLIAEEIMKRVLSTGDDNSILDMSLAFRKFDELHEEVAYIFNANDREHILGIKVCIEQKLGKNEVKELLTALVKGGEEAQKHAIEALALATIECVERPELKYLIEEREEIRKTLLDLLKEIAMRAEKSKMLEIESLGKRLEELLT